jgi:hypothetical protein
MIHLPPIRYLLSINPFIILFNRIGGLMVSVLSSSVVDRGFEPRSGQTKDYKIVMCCFSAKYAA